MKIQIKTRRAGELLSKLTRIPDARDEKLKRESGTDPPNSKIFTKGRKIKDRSANEGPPKTTTTNKKPALRARSSSPS